MFKHYNDKFPPYDLQKIPQSKIDADRDAVFARLGVSGGVSDYSAAEKPVMLRGERSSALRLVLPFAAAAAALAVAVPVGVYLWSKAAPDLTSTVLSAGEGADSSRESESSASTRDYLEAFRAYFAAMLREVPDGGDGGSTATIDAMLDLSRYAVPLDITLNAFGTELSLCGMIDGGDCLYIAYECGDDGFFDTHRFMFEDSRVPHSAYKLGNINVLALDVGGISKRMASNVFELQIVPTEPSDGSVSFTLSNGYAVMPSLNIDCDGGVDCGDIVITYVGVSPFGARVEYYGTQYFFYRVSVLLRDGSVMRCGLGGSADVGRAYFSFPLPVEVEDIAAIKLDDIAVTLYYAP